MDNVDIVAGLVEEGMEWRGIGGERKLEKEGEATGLRVELAESRTMRLIVEESSKLVPGVLFTYNLPEMHQNGRCPVLDLEVWGEGGNEEGQRQRIRYSF